jgi:hypothetical protein
MNSSNDHCIKICNALLRGELSAVETFSQAIDTYSGTAVVEKLRGIRAEHVNSAALLSSNVRDMGGTPGKDSGVWGIFTAAVQGTADLFGKDSALGSLQKGEQIGQNDYQNALADTEVMPECKRLISEELLPAVNRHIAMLETLGKSV